MQGGEFTVLIRSRDSSRLGSPWTCSIVCESSSEINGSKDAEERRRKWKRKTGNGKKGEGEAPSP